ncbi:DUF3017 domain-containing protein [Streptomyces sp. KLOTTS4A1]|uniref:DUF3017 domain-containing protein n=1 Tax=Streptomyces sp. KLOTTS4A1 TaxID=3390996 RepID=UPI0039F49639
MSAEGPVTGAAGEPSAGEPSAEPASGSEAPRASGVSKAARASGASEAPRAPAVSEASGTSEAPARKKSRRFPSITKDTARPEGGGRAAPGDAPAPARQWPMLTVLVLTGTGLLLTAFDVWRPGIITIGAALLTGAVLRWALPSVGMLAVRSRFTDLLTYGILGTAIVLLALMAQPDPVLEIPFLDDTLHFTISS